MIRICIAGAAGRMGRRILEVAANEPDIEVGSAFDLPEREGEEIRYGGDHGKALSVTLASSAATAAVAADVLIDFSVAEACVANVEAATKAAKPAVIGTTGLSPQQQERLANCARSVPVVLAPNMSVGVNLLFQLTEHVAKVLGLGYNVEITEIHHNQKKDSPSGTAVRLAERAADALGLSYAEHVVHGRQGLVGTRPDKEIGVHAIRGGDVAGEHTVAFIGQGERLELTHRAHNRDNFARGALIAARFVVSAEPGLYDMQDVLGLK